MAGVFHVEHTAKNFRKKYFSEKPKTRPKISG